MLNKTPFILMLLVPSTLANIRFPFVQPKCLADGPPGGCLRGQVCLSDSTCKSESLLTAGEIPFIRDVKYQNLRSSATNNAPLVRKSSDHFSVSQFGEMGQQKREFAFRASKARNFFSKGTLSNSRMSQGNQTERQGGEPKMSRPHRSPSFVVRVDGAVTEDGSCGAENGNTVCGDWYKGPCCSMYGFCGDTDGHCGEGCQSGPCVGSPLTTTSVPSVASPNPTPGVLDIVGSAGVAVMHAALLPNGKMMFLDKVENHSPLKLPSGQYAYSSEWDPVAKKDVPLEVKTNPFCAGGAFLPNGQLVSVGGNGPLTDIDPTVGDGFTAIRWLTRGLNNRTLDGSNWVENENKLSTARWYASAQTLPDGRVFVASGSLNGLDPTKKENNNPTFEFLNADGTPQGVSTTMEILDRSQPYYMYPFMHVLRDGSLYVFVAKSSELFDPVGLTTIKKFPDLTGDYRTYPNTGASVMLPLSPSNSYEPEVVVCGGGAYQDITSPTDATCGRIFPLAAEPKWDIETMPEGRVMNEGVLLLDGTVLWVNGANVGAQGFELADKPTYQALIYDPKKPIGQRFFADATSTIPRMYHSVALLQQDGTVMIAGSNPVEQPVLQTSETVPYRTEYQIEVYTPAYLQGDKFSRRPVNLGVSVHAIQTGNEQIFFVSFDAPTDAVKLELVLVHGGFVTHSMHMGQRMIYLQHSGMKAGRTTQQVNVFAPPNTNVAPPGLYSLHAIVDGIPSMAKMVLVQ